LHIKSAVKILGITSILVGGVAEVALFFALSQSGQNGIAFLSCLVMLLVFSGVYKDILYSLKCPLCNEKAGIVMSEKRWSYFPRECVNCGQEIK